MPDLAVNFECNRCLWRRPFDEAKGASYHFGVDINDLVIVDSEILGGTPVFKGTRVPVKSLFEYLEDNYTLDEFLHCFPTVTREQAHRVLDCCRSTLLPTEAA